MQFNRRQIIGALLGSAAASAAAPLFAQAWPARPIRLILPFGPGSATDTLARTISEPLSRALKQPIVIEHKPGANTTIATGLVTKAAPDGYTFGLLTNSGLAASPGVSPVEIAASFLVLAASVPIAMWAAAKVFRTGILMYGKRPRLREVWHWLRQR